MASPSLPYSEYGTRIPRGFAWLMPTYPRVCFRTHVSWFQSEVALCTRWTLCETRRRLRLYWAVQRQTAFGGPFFSGCIFVVFQRFLFVFQRVGGFWPLWLFMSHPLHSQFLSALVFAASAPVLLRVAFLALRLLAAFWLWLFASAFPVGFWPWLLHAQHRQFLSGAPPHPPFD